MLKPKPSVFLYYGAGLILNRLLVFLLLPLLTNVLSPAEFGLWTLLQTLYLILLALSLHGMDEGVLRYASTAGEDRRGYFSTALAGVLIVSLLASLLALFPLQAFLPPEGRLACFRNFSLWLIADAVSLTASAYLRAVQKPLPVALYLACQNALLIALLYVFLIRGSGGVPGLLKAYMITALLSLLFWAPAILREKLPRPSLSLYRILAAFGLPLMVINGMALAINHIDRYLVNYFLGPQATGIYSVNYKLGMVTFMLLSAFRMGWYPKFYALHQQQGRGAALKYSRGILSRLLLVLGSASFFITLFAPEIAGLPVPGGSFIGKEYWAGLSIVGIVALAFLFDAMATILDAFLYFEQRLRLILLATALALAVNLGLNLMFLRPLGLYGAAAATLAAYIALFLFIQIANRRKLGVQGVSAESLLLLLYFAVMIFIAQAVDRTPLKAVLAAAHTALAVYLFFRKKDVESIG
jgi:O-antigen/teichoic acid export membrane protein